MNATANGVKVWRSQDGRRVLMSEMEDRHLRNTIRFLRRHSDALVIRFLRETTAARSNLGEYAADAFDHEALIAADGTDHDRCIFAYDKYRALYSEALGRWGTGAEQMLADTVEQDRAVPEKKRQSRKMPERKKRRKVAPVVTNKWMSEEQKQSALLWTFTDLRVVKTEFVATGEGTYRLTFEDGRTLVFSAVGDDATYCSMEIEKP